MKSGLIPIALAALMICGVVVTGCTAQSPKASGSIVDPLSSLTNPKSPEFIAPKVTPLLDVRGKGPHTYAISRPAGPRAQIEFFLVCTPAAKFRVTMGSWFSAGCGHSIGGAGAIPVSASSGSGPLNITVKIPKSSSYWLVGILYPYD